MESQRLLPQDRRFLSWKHQFDLYLNSSHIWRCGGRVSNSDLPVYSQYPILLDKQHHIARIIIRDAHECLLHAGVKETLTEVRSSFWLVLGRLFVHHIIHDCVICRKSEGRPYQGVPPPPLLEFRVKWLRPFQFTGVDFAGPLYVKSFPKREGRKAWLCLYTCAVNRAVHLNLVPDLNTLIFLRRFKWFTSPCGGPAKMISDNGKTFKSASKTIHGLFTDFVIKKHFSDLQLEWSFNLKKAPCGEAFLRDW